MTGIIIILIVMLAFGKNERWWVLLGLLILAKLL